MKLEAFINLINDKRTLGSIRNGQPLARPSAPSSKIKEESTTRGQSDFHSSKLDARQKQALEVRDQNARHLNQINQGGQQFHEIPKSLTRRLRRPPVGLDAMIESMRADVQALRQAHEEIDRNHALKLLHASSE